MKRVVILFFLLIPFFLHGQNKRIVVREFKKADIGDVRARTSPVLDHNKRITALVDITVPVTDSDILFDNVLGHPLKRAGSWIVRVAEGTPKIKISVPGYAPISYSFPELLESGRVYEMTLGILDMLKYRTLILPVYAYGPSQSSFGAMIGICKRHGGYTKVRTNFTFDIKTTSECSDNGMIGGVKGWFTGENKSSRQTFTAGYLGLLFQTLGDAALYAYGGGGYGTRVLAWQVYGTETEFEYSKVTSRSFSGWEIETGLVFRKGGFALMTGIQTNQFKYVEANVGFGIMF